MNTMNNSNNLLSTATASLDPSLSGLDAIRAVILQNCALYTAFGRRYEEGGRPELGALIAEFVEAHAKLLQGLDAELIRDEIMSTFEERMGCFSDEGYQMAELPALPPKLELTEEDLAGGLVSAREILGCAVGEQPNRFRRGHAVFPDGTVGIFATLKEMGRQMLAAPRVHRELKR